MTAAKRELIVSPLAHVRGGHRPKSRFQDVGAVGRGSNARRYSCGTIYHHKDSRREIPEKSGVMA